MESHQGGDSRDNVKRAAQVIVVSSVMLTFISFWRTAAVVLCDLASTAYYIGAIVEETVGPAAPWFILAVMLFSYAVRSVYIESCSLFVRGGVYRVVKESMGGFLAKLSVSALMFDYILTGPISGVSAGQYIMGLLIDLYQYALQFIFHASNPIVDALVRKHWTDAGSVAIACAATLYFFWENIKGIHESSDKAVKIMKLTTVMALIVLVWCGVTLGVRLYNGRVVAQAEQRLEEVKEQLAADAKAHDLAPDKREELERSREELEAQLAQNGFKKIETPPLMPDLSSPAQEEKAATPAADGQVAATAENSAAPQEEGRPPKLGFLDKTAVGDELASLGKPGGKSWWSLIGFIGLFIAFGHSILAMSGEETLAQVYREVEAPKMLNFKKAAFVVFVYSLVLTAGISFLAVLLISTKERTGIYHDNLIGGLAMNMVGPQWALLCLQGFVVFIGFLILSGAVNTAIIGSNGVLNRVSEDGVMPDWFLKPHRKYGTTYRLLTLVVGLQVFTIVYSWGDVGKLGEAYAFGVVWSFVFKALAMVVLRFRDPTPREHKVPLNVRVGKYEVPIGLSLIFLVLLIAAITNLLTKQTATIWGLSFTAAFLLIFSVTEFVHERRRQGEHHKHLEQFNQQSTGEVSLQSLHITKPYRKLVAIRSTQNLFMLEKALSETDPLTTSVVVMTAKLNPRGDESTVNHDLDQYDQNLMTAVVQRAESAGKEVTPLIVPTNNSLYAVLKTAKELAAQELIIGYSNKFTAEEQLDQLSLYWLNLHGGDMVPLTVRILSRDRDVLLDLWGGNRIPKISERQARTIAELRGAGVGVNRVLMVHDGTQASTDLFKLVLTTLDPQITFDVVAIGVDLHPAQQATTEGNGTKGSHSGLEHITHDHDWAKQVGRDVHVLPLEGNPAEGLVKLAREGRYDLLLVGTPSETDEAGWATPDATNFVRRNAHCHVFLMAAPLIPTMVEG